MISNGVISLRALYHTTDLKIDRGDTDMDQLKMATIISIQMLEKRIGNMCPYTFETLWALDHDSLCEIRDNFIVTYNDVMEARRFAADMIYNR